MDGRLALPNYPNIGEFMVTLLLALIFIASGGHADIPVDAPQVKFRELVDDRQERSDYQAEVIAKLVADDFVGLEAEAAGLVDGTARFTNGDWKLFAFYNALSGGGDPARSGSKWNDHLGHVNLWRVKYPSSVPAALVEAGAYSLRGWAARGNSTADGVTSEGWRRLESDYDHSKALLDELAQKGPVVDPFYVQLRLRLARGSGAGPAGLIATYKSLVPNETPYCFHLVNSVATGLLPKWGGAPGDPEKFCLEATQSQGEDAQCEQIARAAINFSKSGPLGRYFRDRSLSWEQVYHGFVVLFRKYPNSLVNANYLVEIAWEVGDTEQTAKYLRLLAGRADPAVWDGESFPEISDDVLKKDAESKKFYRPRPQN